MRRATMVAVAALLVPAMLSAQARPAPRGQAPARPAPVMTLPALLDLFLLPAAADDGSIHAWDVGTGGDSRVRWAHEGVRETTPDREQQGYYYQRIGLVVIDVDGKPAYQMTYQGRIVPGPWRVTLLGPRAGPIRVEISSEGGTEEGLLDVPRALEAAGWTLTPYKCSRETSPAVTGHVVHLATAPGRRPLWVQESWDYGTMTGMRVAISLLYFKDDADKVECMTRG